VKKFVIASSSSVYGVNSKVPFSESDPIFTAISPYAASKLACRLSGTSITTFTPGCRDAPFLHRLRPRQRPDLAIHKFARLIRDGNPSRCLATARRLGLHLHLDILQGVMACTARSSVSRFSTWGVANGAARPAD